MQIDKPSIEESHNKALYILIVIAVATMTRIYYVTDFQYNPFFYNVYNFTDSIHFYIGGKNFASGDILASSPATQFSMGVATVLLVYLISLELFNLRAAIFGAILYNFYGPALMYEGTLLRASLLAFLGPLSLYLVIQVIKNPKPYLVVAAGIAISLFIQCRPNVSIIFILLPLLYFYPFDKRTLQLLLKMGLVALIFFLPLLIRGWIVHGKFVFFDASGPAAFLIGNHPDYGGVSLVAELEHPGGLNMEFGEMFSIFMDRLTEQPMGMVGLYIRKLYYLFSSLEPYNNYDYLLFKKFSILLNTPLANFSLISSLALSGLVFRIGKGRNIKLLYGFMGGITVAVLLFFLLARFRVPAVPYFAIFAGFTLDTFIRWLKQRQWIKSVQIFLFCSLLIVIFNIPELTRGTQQAYWDDLYFQIGLNLASSERYSQAIEPLDHYLKNNPGDMHTLSVRALALRKTGDTRRSVMTYQKIISLEPENAEAQFNLANLYAEGGDWEKAMFHIKLAERYFKKPEDLNWLHLAQEQNNKFLKQDNTLVKFTDPPDIQIWKQKDYPEGTNYQMGILYFNYKQYPEAIEYLKKHLKNHPEHRKTNKSLALALLQTGENNQAVQILEKLNSMDPEDAGNHFDLATLYADSKNWAEALLHIKTAERLFRKKREFYWANLAHEQTELYISKDRK